MRPLARGIVVLVDISLVVFGTFSGAATGSVDVVIMFLRFEVPRGRLSSDTS
jgi:hypothetical protein